MQYENRILIGSGCEETNNGQHLIEVLARDVYEVHCVQCARSFQICDLFGWYLLNEDLELDCCINRFKT